MKKKLMIIWFWKIKQLMMLYKNADKFFSNKNENSLQKVKNLLNLRAEIYKKMTFEEKI